MKNQFLGLITLMCYAVAFSAEMTDVNDTMAVVTGHGEVLPEGVIVTLTKWDGMSGITIATDTIKNGQFRLEVPVEEGFTMGSIGVQSPEFPSLIHRLYLTPNAVVEIDAVDNYMFTWPVRSNVPEQADYDLFIINNKKLWTEFQKAHLEYTEKMNSVHETIERQESEKIYNAYSQKSDSIYRLICQRDLVLLKERPVNKVWLDIAKDLAMQAEYVQLDSEDLKKMYANLDASLKNSREGQTIYGYLYPDSHIGIGDKFPDTEFFDIVGNAHRFSEFQGKWCLVDFWSSGCAACRWALPELRELKEKYPETLELISLSLDTDNMWRQQSKELPLMGNNWNEGKEDYGMFRRFGLTARPSFLAVAPDGTIKDIWSGYATGSLKHKMSFFLRPKGKTEYTESNGIRTIMFPHYKANKTDNILDIDRIEINDKGTKVYFSFVYIPNQWISLPADAYLTDSNGEKYNVIGSEGIVLGEHLFADNEGNGAFSITFKTIPKDINTIDFRENPSNDSWSIEGITFK